MDVGVTILATVLVYALHNLIYAVRPPACAAMLETGRKVLYHVSTVTRTTSRLIRRANRPNSAGYDADAFGRRRRIVGASS